MDWCQIYIVAKVWQTLLAALLALLAAWATINTMKKQMAQSDEHAEDIRRRKEMAARAALPGALSSLIGYARESGVLPAILRPAIESNEIGRHANETVLNATTPELPEEALTVLKECIEFSPDGAAEWLAEIFRSLQIQNARLVELIARCNGEAQQSARPGHIHVVNTLNADQTIIDAACLHARLELLFLYARAETNTVPDHIELSDIERALFFFGVYREEFGDVHQMAERRFQNSNENDDGS